MAFPRGWCPGIGLILALATSLSAAPNNDAANILHVPRQFRAELAAGAPAILNPIAIAFDDNGRLFVLEQSGQIRLLAGTNADGTFDTATVFADNVSPATALVYANGGLFVASGNRILFLQDTNGDGIADINRIALNAPDTKPIHDLAWRPDNRIIAVGAGFSFDLRTLQVSPELSVGERSLCFDEQGRAIFCAENQPFRTALFDPRYPARNIFLQPPDPLQNILGLENTLHATGSCLIYRSLVPTNVVRDLLIADPDRNSIHALALHDQNLDILAEKGSVDFVTSDDPEFSPQQIVAGPGGIYILDAQAGRAQQGRIWRIVPEYTTRSIFAGLHSATTYDLVATLASTDTWRRDTAARLLCERRDRTALPLLVSALRYAKVPEARLYALQVLGNLGALTEEYLVTAIQDRDARVRARAVLFSEKFVKDRTISPQLFHWLALAAQDSSEWVRYQLAFTLGEISNNEKSTLLAGIFTQDPTDLWIQTAIFSSLSDGGGNFFVQLASDPIFSQSASGSEFLIKVLTVVGVENQPNDLTPILQFIENRKLPPLTAYIWLRDLADGLRRGGGSLASADPDGRLRPFYVSAFQLACDYYSPEPSRIAALRLFEVANYYDLDAPGYLLDQVIPAEPLSIQVGCMHALARYNLEHIATLLIQHRPPLIPAMREQIIEALLSHTNNASALLSALEGGQLLTPSNFSSTEVNFLRTYGDSAIENRAANIFGAQNTNGIERMHEFAPALKLAGSADRGHTLFNTRCLACHSNGKLGPPLAYAERPNREKILSDIVNPGADITPGYSTYTVDLGTGEKLPGLMADPGAPAAVLREPNGTELLLPRAGRLFVTRQNWSLMPDEVAEGLSPQDMADLIEYVASLH